MIKQLNQQSTPEDWEEFKEDWEYLDAKPFGEGRYIATHRLMYTHAIVTGHTKDTVAYDDRWCYHDYASAKKAFEEWNPEITSEPNGWHRHPNTGRRREGGDPTKETINF